MIEKTEAEREASLPAETGSQSTLCSVAGKVKYVMYRNMENWHNVLSEEKNGKGLSYPGFIQQTLLSVALAALIPGYKSPRGGGGGSPAQTAVRIQGGGRYKGRQGHTVMLSLGKCTSQTKFVRFCELIHSVDKHLLNGSLGTDHCWF